MACSRIVFNAKFNTSSICTYDIMTATYLSQVHNMSLLFGTARGSGTNLDSHNNQFISQEVGFFKESRMRYFYMSGLSYSRLNVDHLVYCYRQMFAQKYVDTAVWMLPFKKEVWLLSLFAFLAGYPLFFGFKVPTQFFRSLLNMVINISSLVALQPLPAPRSSKLYAVFIVLFTSLVLEFYKSEITSLMVVPSQVTPFESVKELLNSGYKILAVSNKPEIKYEMDFELNGVLSKLNSSFSLASSILKNNQDHDSLLPYMSGIHGKYAIVAAGANAEIFPIVFESQIVEHELVANMPQKCTFVKKPLFPAVVFKIIYTVNRYWMMQTIQRMHERGLKNIWHTWVVCVDSLVFKKKREMLKSVRTIGVIQLPQVTPLMIVLGTVYLFCVILCVVEFLQK